MTLKGEQATNEKDPECLLRGRMGLHAITQQVSKVLEIEKHRYMPEKICLIIREML